MRVSQVLCRWIKAHVGLLITEKNIDSVALACQSLANELAMSVADLEQVVLSSSPDLVRLQAPAELTQASLLDLFIDRITTHEAYFLRHEENMRLVARSFAHDCINKRGCFRVLSLPCAAGEEPYSLAMCLHEQGINIDQVQIVAADISRVAIDKAKQGEYSPYALRKLTDANIARYFDCLSKTCYRVKSHLKKNIQYLTLNILKPSQLSGQFDFIFCQNVLIYFDNPERKRALNNLLNLLQDDGHILVESAEASYVQSCMTDLNIGVKYHQQMMTFCHKKSADTASPPSGINRDSQNTLIRPPTPTSRELNKAIAKPVKPNIIKPVNSTTPNIRKPAANQANDKDRRLTSEQSTLLQQAQLAYKKKSFNQAMALYVQSAEQVPESRCLAMLGQAKIFADQDQQVEALEMAEASLAIHHKTKKLTPSQEADNHAIIGLILKQRGLHQLADKHLSRLKELQPNHVLVKLI